AALVGWKKACYRKHLPPPPGLFVGTFAMSFLPVLFGLLSLSFFVRPCSFASNCKIGGKSVMIAGNIVQMWQIADGACEIRVDGCSCSLLQPASFLGRLIVRVGLR